ncbi:unnamed protein product [Ixodes pacificus]
MVPAKHCCEAAIIGYPRPDAGDERSAIWSGEKSPNDFYDCHEISTRRTGRYDTSGPMLRGGTNPGHRRRLRLVSVAPLTNHRRQKSPGLPVPLGPALQHRAPY